MMSNATGLLQYLRHDLVRLAHRGEAELLPKEEQAELCKGYLLLLEKYEIFLDWCWDAVHAAPPPAHLRHMRKESHEDETP